MTPGARVWGAALVVVALLVASPAGAAPAPTTTTTRPTSSTTAPKRGATAADAAKLDARVRSLQSQVAEASREEAALLAKLDAANDRRRDIEARLKKLDADMAVTTARLSQAAGRLARVDAELEAAEARLAETTAKLAAGRNALKQRAIDAYVGRTSTALTGATLRVTTLRELAAAGQYLRTLLEAHRRVVDSYDEARQDAQELQLDVAARRHHAQAQRDLVARHRAELDRARQGQEALRAQAAAEAAKHNALLAEVRRRKAEFTRTLAQLKADSESIARMLRGVQAGQGPASSGKGILASPIPGARITSTYGMRRHPIYGDMRMHSGIDFGAGMGTPIRAAGDGTVVEAAARSGYGTTVVVDHGDSLASLYAHQSRLAVAKGARVTKGQIIGYVGSTGYSTGPHLHFEVRVKGTPVDPMKYL